MTTHTPSPQEIYLNSKYGTLKLNGSSDNSDILFYVNHPLVCPKNYSMAIRVTSFVFPVSFTLVDEDNDKLVVDGITYLLTHGNYNALTMKTHIQSLLPGNFGLDYYASTLKYTFSNALDDFTLNKESTCFSILGFTEGEDHTSTGGELTSDGLVDFSGVNEVYVDLPNILTSNISSKSGQKTSIVKSIPVSVSPGRIMIYSNYTGSYVYIQQQTLSFFHVRILGDDLTTPVRFNKQDWQLTLEVSFVPTYDQSETSRQDYKEAYDSYVEKMRNPSKAETK